MSANLVRVRLYRIREKLKKQVLEENKEQAAEAIAEFIKVTLQSDRRSDGKSIWDCVDGSIVLVTDIQKEGEYKSIRNISFSLRPEYNWIFDENVDALEIAEEIVIPNKAEAESEG